MRDPFARRFAALGCIEGLLCTIVWCAVAAVARLDALPTALAAGILYVAAVVAGRLALAKRLHDPARVIDVALFTSTAGALVAAALAGFRYGAPAALILLGSSCAVALAMGGQLLRLAPPAPAAGRGVRLVDVIGSPALVLAVAGWATTAGALLGAQVALGISGRTGAFVRAAALYGPAFLLFVVAAAGAYGRTLAASIDRVREAVFAMARSGRLEKPIAVTDGDDVGALAAALGALRTYLFQELDRYEQALDRARKAEARKEEFFGQLTRELHGPLQAIVAEARDLEAGRRGSLDDAQRTDVRVIESAAYHLLGLLDDVVDLTVLQSGTLKLAPVELDAAALARAVVRELGGLVIAAKKPLALRADAEGPLPIWADPRRMRQVLSNLVTNAIKFSEQGQVTVTARAAAGPDPAIMISVSDSGPGIAADELAHIFDQYRQVGSPGAKRAGYGLGLAIAMRLVELHGGTLTVKSTPGQGSTFTISLPDRRAS